MKKIYFLITMMLISVSLNAQTVLTSQGFEGSSTDTWNYTITPGTYNQSNDVWAIVSSVGSIDGPEAGANFWGLRDIENNNGGGDIPHTIAFDETSVLDETNVVVTFNYYSAGFDSSDELSVEFFFDNISQGVEYLEKDTDAWVAYSKVIPDGTNTMKFTLTAVQNGGSDYAGFDSITLQSGAATTPAAVISYPTEGQVVNVGSEGFDALISSYLFALSGDDGSGASDGTGEGYIQYALDGGTLIDKFDIDAITYTGLSIGAHTLFAQLVDNTGTATAYSTTVNFTINDIIQTLPIYEGFDYTTGESLGGQPNWVFEATANQVVIGAESLSYPGLEASTGNHAIIDGEGNDPTIEFVPVTTGEVFASFIINVTDLSQITDEDGAYFIVLGQFDTRFWIVPSADAPTSKFHIGSGFNAFGPPLTSTLYATNEDIFVVLSYHTETGVINTWVNPTHADLQSTTAPTPTLTQTSTETAGPVSKFWLRQDSTDETPTILFDELRISQSWEDATPFTTLSNDEFNVSNFEFYPNPTNIGSVTISSTLNDAISVQVFDILGKQVQTETLTNNTLDVSRLNAGVYLVKITQNNNSVTKKLIVR